MRFSLAQMAAGVNNLQKARVRVTYVARLLPSRWASRSDRITADLALDATQQKQVAAILAKQSTGGIQAMRDDMRKQLETLLTAFHADTFDAAKAVPQDDRKDSARGMDKQIAFVSQLLPILHPDQREKPSRRSGRCWEWGAITTTTKVREVVSPDTLDARGTADFTRPAVNVAYAGSNVASVPSNVASVLGHAARGDLNVTSVGANDASTTRGFTAGSCFSKPRSISFRLHKPDRGLLEGMGR